MHERERFYLAIGTMGVGLLIIIGLALLMVFVAAEQKLDAAENAFNTVIPLIGTWIGAIIAFYYGRENFEAAQKQFQKLLDKDSLDDIQVRNIMIHTKTMVFKKLDKELKTSLEEYHDFLLSVDKSRLPLLHEDGSPKYILHKSAIEQELLQCAKSNEPVKKQAESTSTSTSSTEVSKESESESSENNETVASGDQNRQDSSEKPTDSSKKPTIGEFLKRKPDHFGYNMKKGFIVVDPETKLETALRAMRQLEGCQDIFVTDNGRETGKVIGWITDTLANNFLDLRVE